MRYLCCLAAAPLLAAATTETPETVERVVPTPLGNPAYWVTPLDYPRSAKVERRVGIVSFRLDIDENGDVMECRITHSSGTAALDDATCILLQKRARFIPPVDARGRPVRAYYLNRVRWTLDGEPFEPSDMFVEFDLDTQGNLTNCRSAGLQAMGRGAPTCAVMATQMRTRIRPSQPIHVRMRNIVEVTPLASAPESPAKSLSQPAEEAGQLLPAPN